MNVWCSANQEAGISPYELLKAYLVLITRVASHIAVEFRGVIAKTTRDPQGQLSVMAVTRKKQSLVEKGQSTTPISFLAARAGAMKMLRSRCHDKHSKEKVPSAGSPAAEGAHAGYRLADKAKWQRLSRCTPLKYAVALASFFWSERERIIGR